MMIEDEYVKYNAKRRVVLCRESDNTTKMDDFGWTPWFKLFPSVHNLCIERSVEVLCVRYEWSILA